MLALADYERKVHSVCGLHDSIAKTDPDITIVDDVCPLCQAVEVELRRRADEEHAAEEDADASTPRASDGRSTYVQLLRPVEGERSVAS